MQRVFVGKDETLKFTIELFIKLNQFREKHSALTWEKFVISWSTEVPLANE